MRCRECGSELEVRSLKHKVGLTSCIPVFGSFSHIENFCWLGPAQCRFDESQRQGEIGKERSVFYSTESEQMKFLGGGPADGVRKLVIPSSHVCFDIRDLLLFKTFSIHFPILLCWNCRISRKATDMSCKHFACTSQSMCARSAVFARGWREDCLPAESGACVSGLS